MGVKKCRILVVDNYDSFVYSLVHYLGQLHAEVTILRNDAIDLNLVSGFDGVLVSPGPGTPELAGQSIEVIQTCAEQEIPLLGVCLGHQAIAVAFGATVSPAPELLHGKTSNIHHRGQGVLANIPTPFTATRYHSLAIESGTLPKELEVTGWTDSEVIMSIEHTYLPISGVQFHPESVLTEHGHLMLAQWLERCGDGDARQRSIGLSPITKLA